MRIWHAVQGMYDPSYFVKIINILQILRVCKLLSKTVQYTVLPKQLWNECGKHS